MKRKILFFAAAAVVFSMLLYAQEKPDALLLYNQGKYDDAAEVCLNEIKDMPRNMDSYVVLAWSLIKLGRYDDALEYSRKGSNVNRYDPRIIESLGESYFYLGKNVEALKYFEEYAVLLPTGPRIAVVYSFMGEIYIRLAEYNHADIAFSTAVYHSSNIARWWARLGYSREMAGDYTYALSAYDKALRLNSSLPEAVRGRESVLEKLAEG